MATANKDTFFLRNGFEDGAPMEALFDLHGISAVLLMDGTGSVSVHKATRQGHAKAPIAKGQLRRSNMRGAKSPDLVGEIATKQGTEFGLVAWFHDDAHDPYYVVRYDIRPRRQGSVFRPDAIAN